MRRWLAAGVGGAVGVALAAGCPTEEDPTPCGNELTCAADEACVREDYEPACSSLDPDIDEPSDSDCPENQRLTACGGAGLPCCCDQERPPSTYTCAAADACGSDKTCDCVEDPCPGSKECALSGTKETLVCALMPE